MFKKYGFLGIALIIFAEFIMLLKIEPFSTWYIPIIWFGYILLIDSIIYALKGNSLLSNRPRKFIVLMCVSINFWYLFEVFNYFLGGWKYFGLPESLIVAFAMGTLSFATIVPAVFETGELVEQFHLFSKMHRKIKFLTNKLFVNILIVVGLIFIALPLVMVSPWMWILVWTGFVLLLDPILYLFHNEKSLIMQARKGKYNTVISLFIAGYVCGFLWEFWNYWAGTGWVYTVPILENIKIFEIPAFGFLAYGAFAWELYVMYQFVRFLFSRTKFHGIAGIRTQVLASRRLSPRPS